MDALVLANDVRCARAALKKHVKEYTVDPIRLLQGVALGSDLDALVERSKLDKVLVVDFLLWIPQVGKEKAKQVLFDHKIREGLTLEHLAPSRRIELTCRLRDDLARYTTYRGKSARVGTAATAAVPA